MKVKSTIGYFSVITVLYIIILIWVNSRNQNYSELLRILSIMPVLMGLSILSYLVRYMRWYWLLCRAGKKIGFVGGFIIYIAGFAYTATPGKVGELLRIRYLVNERVPPETVIALFVFERTFDLIVLLLISSLMVNEFVFLLVCIAVLVILSIVFGAVYKPEAFSWLYIRLYHYRFKRLARILKTVRDGLSETRNWFTTLDVVATLAMGLLAWGFVSCSFYYLLVYLDLFIPVYHALAIYPLAMLAGGVSMLPGGLGSTEAVLVLLLTGFGVSYATAILVAVGIRVSTLWLAIILGLLCMLGLEFFVMRRAICR